jgi:SWI/SNF-related matrix-associated actin-dependent regulator of chromatin subfamily A3
VNAQLQNQGPESYNLPRLSTAVGASIVLNVSLVGHYFELHNEGGTFARLDKSFCSKAHRLVDMGVKFKAVLDWKHWEAFSRGWAPRAVFSVEVHVYSLRHHAEKVGSMLLRSGIFLQCPILSEESEVVEYYNPQILEVDGFVGRPEEVMSEPDESPAPQFVPELPSHPASKPSTGSSEQVESILNSLSHTSILHEICTDIDRIKSTLMG